VWANKRVAVILPTYNERDSIRRVIDEFFATGVVDDVLVIDNNAAPGTSEEVDRTSARQIHEPKQGYGNAIQRGLREVDADYLVVCEPDATFLANDVFKFLSYGSDFDVVYGSRTSQRMIWSGANMGWFLRWGNWAVAKYMELLFDAPSLTDVGCTYRLLSRAAAQRMQGSYEIAGNAFGPEMMIRTFQNRLKTIQIPVNYLPRVGQSSVTGDPAKAFGLGMWMIWLITKERFRRPRSARV